MHRRDKNGKMIVVVNTGHNFDDLNYVQSGDPWAWIPDSDGLTL